MTICLVFREPSTHWDENLNDPQKRIAIAQSHVFYRPSVGQQ